MDIVKSFTSNNLSNKITFYGNYENPLFKASEIGKILDLTNIRATIQKFDKKYKVVNEIDTPGGKQEVVFLTEKGLYQVLFRSKKKIAEEFQDWVTDVISDIRLTGKYELENKIKEYENNTKLLEAEIERLSIIDGTPIVYIFNTDIRKDKSPLKIGITEHIRERSKPFKQVHPYGKIVFTHNIPDTNLRTMENWIFALFYQFRIKGEMFDIELDDAITWIMHEINSLNISNIQDHTKKMIILRKVTDYENLILCNDEPLINKKNVSTQTDLIIENNNDASDDNDETILFDKFISECCTTEPNYEVSGHDITGQFRLWSKKNNRETYHKLLDYLKTRFCPIRLKLQNANNVLNGFRGVMLKVIEYKKSYAASDPETFIFQVCVFVPSGKVLRNDLEAEYTSWKKKLNKPLLKDDNKELKKFLDECDYTLSSNVWTPSGNGTGYYGLHLKQYDNYAKKVSCNAKSIQKRTTNHEIVNSWPTIAKAAEAEAMSPAKMSRLIKKNIINDNFYFINMKT